MKKLLLPFMALTLVFTSCGKSNNNVASSGAPAPAPITNPIVSNIPNAQGLIAKIDDYHNQFGWGTVYDPYGYTTTWGTLANTGVNLIYRYTKSTGVPTNSNCKTKWEIFYVCSSFSSTNSGIAESRAVSNTGVDITAKIAELKSILASADPIYGVQVVGSYYYIRTTTNMQYVIDTSVPLQANPIGIRNMSYTEYLYNITW